MDRFLPSSSTKRLATSPRWSIRSNFRLAVAEEYEARPALSVTGVVTNDVSRAVAVLPLASGRAIDVRVRLGDTVQQGQLLMRVKSPDISSAFSDYRHAVTDEVLARAQLDRAKALYERGAVAQKDLEVAQDAEDKAKVDVETTAEHLRVLGVDPERARRHQHRRHHGARFWGDNRTERDQCHRRPVTRLHAEPLHDFGPLARLDRVRRL